MQKYATLIHMENETQPVITDINQSALPPQEMRPQLNARKPILFTLVGILILGGIVFAGTQLQKSRSLPSNSAETTPIASAVPDVNEQTEKIVATKTFAAPQWNITFSYPSEWMAQVRTTGAVLVPPQNWDSKKQVASSYPWIKINTHENPKRLSLKEYSNDDQWTIDPGLYYQDAKPLTIDGKEGFSISSVNCEPTECDKVIILVEDTIYELTLDFDFDNTESEKKAYRDVFAQIVSTIQFTKNDQ